MFYFHCFPVLLLAYLLFAVNAMINPSRLSNEREGKVREKRGDLIMGEDGALLTPEQLDAQDEPLRSTLINGPLSQTITELGGRPILSQAFDLSKASANEPYRIVRRERLRLPNYVHDISGGVTPQPITSSFAAQPSPYGPFPSQVPYATYPQLPSYASYPQQSPYAAYPQISPYASYPQLSPYTYQQPSPYASYSQFSPYASYPPYAPYPSQIQYQSYSPQYPFASYSQQTPLPSFSQPNPFASYSPAQATRSLYIVGPQDSAAAVNKTL